MKKEYLERIYAGWLAKIIGIRYGAPVEGWTYEKIKNIYGELTDYPVDYREFAADDDSNGPLFYLRGLEDGGHGAEMTAQDVANALLNYAPYEHGFFWWGGYGTSTEHTAYLNLRNGIPAPMSGSIEQNGFCLSLNESNRPRQTILPIKPCDFTAQCKRARAASIMLSFPWRASVLSSAHWMSGAIPASICCMFTS